MQQLTAVIEEQQGTIEQLQQIIELFQENAQTTTTGMDEQAQPENRPGQETGGATGDGGMNEQPSEGQGAGSGGF